LHFSTKACLPRHWTAKFMVLLTLYKWNSNAHSVLWLPYIKVWLLCRDLNSFPFMCRTQVH
jgi:hypothetical protein